MFLGPAKSVGAVGVLLETLRPQPRLPTEVLQRAWNALPPGPMLQLIQMERCTLWLYRRIRALGLEPAMPAELLSALREQATQQAARNLLIDAQALELSQWLAARSTPHVFLKGIALRASAPDLPYADARSTTDVDVLLPAERAQEAWEALQREGFAPVRDPTGNRTVHHLFPLWSANRVSVEIHTTISPPVAAQDMWERTYRNARSVSWQGQTVTVPSPTDLLWQSVSHAVRDGAPAWFLRYFQDPAIILASGVPIEWDEVERRLGVGTSAEGDRAARWLATAADLAGVRLPGRLASVAPCALKTLLSWRFWTITHLGNLTHGKETLLDVATRIEAQLPLLNLEELSLDRKLRHFVAVMMAQAGFRFWRGLRSVAPEQTPVVR